jgi:glycosyltransferase involved in cell wall biosynthesis
MKLAVFPNDDLDAYIKKGEVRENYFNPDNLFTEIYFFNLTKKKSIDEKLMQVMCGRASYKIVFLGEYSSIQTVLRQNQIAKESLRHIRRLKPDCIRSYGMMLTSYFAAYCSRHANVPLLLSLHDNYNEYRDFSRRSGRYTSFFFFTYWKLFRERMILNQASKVIAVYGYAKQYAMEMGVPENKIAIIHNRVNDSFRPSKNRKPARFTILNVMRQVWEKNQEVLVRAVAPLKDVQLVLIGSGPDHEKLKALAAELGCGDRVIFKPRVVNTELHKEYQRSHVFASSIKQGGVGIPDLEAFCSGIPVVHARHPNEKKPELLSEYALMPENTPEAFRKAFKELQKTAVYRSYYHKSLKAESILRQEQKAGLERKLYKEIL